MSKALTTVIAAIDIGSSAIRMDVAEVRSDGQVLPLESLKKGVQLGKDAFTDGVLSEESIRAACGVLQDFKRVMDTYGVLRYRAVATSAVRESTNRETFLDRVLMSTGLDVQILDSPEENRLTYSAVLETLKDGPELQEGSSLLVEVGGGNADITLIEGNEPLQSGTYPLGAIRLRAGIASTATHEQQMRVVKRRIANILANVRRSIALKDAVNFIALGGDVRFAALAAGGGRGNLSPTVLAREEFEEFVESVFRSRIETLVRKYALSYLDAETLVPALMTYLLLLRETKARSVIVSGASIRAGILAELTPEKERGRLKKLASQILSAARSLGRKYQYDEGHAERVKDLSDLLFGELSGEQRMSDAHRLYLQVAALLHDIGLFLNTRAHHKHSHYLIVHSDLFGLRQRELDIIGNIARYHRRALPQRSHPTFMVLERDERVLVSKLAAILRVANALDKGQLQKVADISVSRDGDHIVLTASNVSDLSMERAALAGRSEFFSEVFGKRIILREAEATS